MKGHNSNLIEKTLAITPIKTFTNESLFNNNRTNVHSLENSIINYNEQSLKQLSLNQQQIDKLLNKKYGFNIADNVKRKKTLQIFRIQHKKMSLQFDNKNSPFVIDHEKNQDQNEVLSCLQQQQMSPQQLNKIKSALTIYSQNVKVNSQQQSQYGQPFNQSIANKTVNYKIINKQKIIIPRKAYQLGQIKEIKDDSKTIPLVCMRQAICKQQFQKRLQENEQQKQQMNKTSSFVVDDFFATIKLPDQNDDFLKYSKEFKKAYYKSGIQVIPETLSFKIEQNQLASNNNTLKNQINIKPQLFRQTMQQESPYYQSRDGKRWTSTYDQYFQHLRQMQTYSQQKFPKLIKNGSKVPLKYFKGSVLHNQVLQTQSSEKRDYFEDNKERNFQTDEDEDLKNYLRYKNIKK